uniref:WhiB family transcriptional regulator n=1 Tax=Actinoplanes sp. CA-084688 TaxID=3239901 RepID=UPI003F49675A
MKEAAVTILLNPPLQVPAEAGNGGSALALELLLATAPGVRDWRDEALCSQTDPEAFFPHKGGSAAQAKRTCGRCPVRADCLEYALANDERFGIWGGLSATERRALASRTNNTTASSETEE